MEDVEVIAASAICLFSIYNYACVLNKYKVQQRHRRRKRRMWMNKIHRNRTLNSMEQSFQDMIREDSGEFNNFCRMSPSDFEFLLSKIEPMIKRQSRLRIPITPKIRLALTLRYLATGDSYRNLHYLFKVSPSAISLIIPAVCKAINIVLKDQIKLPQSPEHWLSIEEGFRRQFPRCIGALDGKHIVIKCPTQSGSGAYTIVLMALVDMDYNFIFANIESKEHTNDCLLWQKIDSNNINLPPDTPLPGREQNVPYVFLGDGALASHKHLIIPYPGNHNIGTKEHTFNYILSSTRVVVENVFGLLTNVFRVFRKPIEIDIEKAPIITMTCILLHNFLRRSQSSQNIYTPPGTFDAIIDGELVEGSWRQHNIAPSVSAIRPIPLVATDTRSEVSQIRSEYTDYFYNLNL
ncbi:uncharacterized protein LOC126367811 [Pectinophora gossypiella]|uniref:uncharacterized protein LOC126367811 n=1 Tax=Pectinophora gossypiella TaxID=13191 RepID=UPI00214E09D7|nr:uncharacterized protein LOC126367811 [Pectinophora gossypiella]